MSSPTGALRVLQGTCDVDANVSADGADIDLLLIPGVSTPKVDTWLFANPAWLSTVLPTGMTRARVLAFDYTIALADGEFSCQDLLQQGDVLLQALHKTRSQSEDRPLFGVCHSVGGLVLKQALCIANEQRYHYGSVLDSVAGIVFFGTPHQAIPEADTLASLLTILASTSNLKKRITIPENRLNQEIAMLSQLAARFESAGISAPVLTVSETKKTKVTEGLLHKSKTIILTGKSLCAVNSPSETFLPLPLDHAGLCHFELVDHASKYQLRQFIWGTLSDTMSKLAAQLQDLEFKYATTSTYSQNESEYLLVPQPAAGALTPNSTTMMATGGSSELLEFEVIPSLQDDSQRRPQPKLPCIMLESHGPGRVFFGRENVLDAIRDALVPVKGGRGLGLELKQFSICGLGGVGKTEIATEFALRHKDDFDAIFWIRADEPAKLDECFQEVSVKLGLETAAEAQSQVVSRSIVKGWLANPIKSNVGGDDYTNSPSADNDASWLIIFDNADDPKLLGDYWPEGSGSVLITSRDPLAKRLFSTRSSGMDLESLSDADGGALLLKLTESDDGPEEDNIDAVAQEISRSLAGLPLAIAQMAGIIRRHDLSLSEFVATYNDNEERAALYGMNFNSSVTYQYSIASVWAFEKLSQEAKVLLKLATFLDPDTIQETILFDAATLMFPDSYLTKFKFFNARTELTQSSLVKRDKGKNELSEYRLSVHRLVQDAVLVNMTDEERISIFSALTGLLWTNWPSAMSAPTKSLPLLQSKDSNNRYQIRRYPLCAALYPHIIRLKQLWPSVTEVTAGTKIQFAALMKEAAWYQHERGRTRDYEGFYTLAEELCESIPGDESDAVLADIHFCQGFTNDRAESRRRKEAFFALQQSICQSIAPDFVDERLGLAYAELGVCNINDGRLDEAIEVFQHERVIRDKLGIKIPLSRDANLAIAHMMRGELDLAENVLQDSLELAELTKSSKLSMRVGRLIYTLGNLRNLQGRHDEAYQLHLQSYQLFQETMGFWEVLNARHKIAEHYMRMKRYDEALEMINAALQIWSYDAEVNKAELARTTFLKAKLLESLGKSQKAKVAFNAAAKLRAELVPADKRNIRSLSVEDFDESIILWNR